MEIREPGQVRKEAALSGHLQALRERRTGATNRRPRLGFHFEGGCTIRFTPSLSANAHPARALVYGRRVAAPKVAVAIPAFNEADGLSGFLVEIDRALAPLVDELRIVVVDDASTDGTAEAASASAPQLDGAIETITNQRNEGHGPTLMTAYRRALGATRLRAPGRRGRSVSRQRSPARACAADGSSSRGVWRAPVSTGPVVQDADDRSASRPSQSCTIQAMAASARITGTRSMNSKLGPWCAAIWPAAQIQGK